MEEKENGKFIPHARQTHCDETSHHSQRSNYANFFNFSQTSQKEKQRRKLTKDCRDFGRGREASGRRNIVSCDSIAK